ncbi:type II toxin-antitoxin system TacA family antitoxin [Oscillatoria salina]|uniref:type II toxin-antitoxin system TacA family antitoxin n=1 Tax=Oscillatoria salina TaxID=331517 RepID=UPI0013BD83FA|nr:DUF1778 domain-containing protein [Oscillatoria salina]MBZ8181416.1 DUF1778 domain-containing protein [Oscillatoria salina IIICB1]NET88722.1 DUF1778 domain-containing protein [Kamptonema sp. SIO1D9]
MSNKVYFKKSAQQIAKSARLEARITPEQKELINLSRRDQEFFAEALLNPPVPSEKLRSSAQRYKKRMGR